MDDNMDRTTQASAPSMVDFAAVLGDQMGRLLATVGAHPEVVALAGLRMTLSALAHSTAHDKDAARELARYIGLEMLAAVDEFGLRDEMDETSEATDGA